MKKERKINMAKPHRSTAEGVEQQTRVWAEDGVVHINFIHRWHPMLAGLDGTKEKEHAWMTPDIAMRIARDLIRAAQEAKGAAIVDDALSWKS